MSPVEGQVDGWDRWVRDEMIWCWCSRRVGEENVRRM